MLSALAGCGGGSGSSSLSGPTTGGNTRKSQLTRFDVDVATGKVTVTPGAASGAGSRAILTNGAVSFVSSDLISVPGDSGKRLISVKVANNSGESIGDNPRLIITGLQNKGSVSARNATAVTTFAGDGGTTDRDGYATSAGIVSPQFIVEGSVANSIRLFATTGTHAIRIVGLDGTVATFAGKSGTAGFADNTGADARFNSPGQIASDSNGNLFVADTNNNAIRRISPTGAVATIAGTGAAGSANGDGNVSTFRAPVGIAVTPNGNRIYVSDTGNHTIRLIRFDPSNRLPRDLAYSYTVSTVAGSAGMPGFSDGDGTNARLNTPGGLTISSTGTFGSDTVYLADTRNNSIRVLYLDSDSSATVKVNTVAGTGTAGALDSSGQNATFNNPLSVVTQSGGGNTSSSPTVILVGDTLNHRVRALMLPIKGDFRAPSDYRVVTLAGDGTAGSTDGDGNNARFNGPAGIALLGSNTPSGTAYVVESAGNRVRKLTYNSGLLLGVGSDSTVTEPVRLLNGNSEVPGEAAAWVRPVSLSNDRGTDLQFYVPQGVSGFTFTAYIETDTGLINLPAVGASFLTSLGGDGRPGDNEGPGKLAELNGPIGVTSIEASSRSPFDSNSKITPRAFIADSGNHRIRYVTPLGNFGTFVGSRQGFADGRYTGAQFSAPTDIAFSSRTGNLYVTDTGNRRIRRITSDGIVTTIAGNGNGGNLDGAGDSATFESPRGIAVDDGGTVYVSDQTKNVIRRIRYFGGDPSQASSYQVTTIAGSAGLAGTADGVGTAARFNGPFGLSCDTDGRVYVVDSQNSTIRVLTRTGSSVYAVTTIAGTAGTPGFADGVGVAARFRDPLGVTVDTAHNVYVSDFGNNRIRRISPQGAVVTVIGSAAGYLNGTAGLISGPAMISLEEGGNLLIADFRNHSLRALQRLVTDAQNN